MIEYIVAVCHRTQQPHRISMTREQELERTGQYNLRLRGLQFAKLLSFGSMGLHSRINALNTFLHECVPVCLVHIQFHLTSDSCSVYLSLCITRKCLGFQAPRLRGNLILNKPGLLARKWIHNYIDKHSDTPPTVHGTRAKLVLPRSSNTARYNDYKVHNVAQYHLPFFLQLVVVLF